MTYATQNCGAPLVPLRVPMVALADVWLLASRGCSPRCHLRGYGVHCPLTDLQGVICDLTNTQGTMLIDYYSAVFCTPTPRQGGAVLTIVLIPTGLLRPSRDAAVRLIVVCFPVYPYFVQNVKELVCVGSRESNPCAGGNGMGWTCG